FGLIGLGDWFRYFTGILEIVGGLLFLVPIAMIAGASILVVTMLGAMVVQAAVLEHPADSIFPALYLFGVVLAFGKLRKQRSSG
ncbi:MAG TPA: DoxX family protein, partial [Gemmatimonadaceae bacterium]|nr:DoxX family protein [Gemmatimonadaceae bacterium]